ncbi:hypothetical protein BH11ACT2_BH11ACT2_22060 [soil metagenome]
MSWPTELLASIAKADEVDLILSSPAHPAIEVPVWVVVVGDEVVMRSYTGVGARWYCRATRHPQQSIRVGTLTIGVTFVPVAPAKEVDEAYDEKYARFDYVNAMSKPLATAASLRLDYRP